MTEIKTVLDLIKEREVKYVDFRFTDPRGKWQHLTCHERTITEDLLREGVMFDGSAIAGWKATVDISDMTLLPDCATAVIDPFAAQTSLILFCDVHEPLSREPYGRDPRSTGKKAERYLLSTGIGDRACFGPEAEFFIFDDVRFSSTMQGSMYEIDSEEGPYVSARKFEDGNTGHRPPVSGGYAPVPPVDGQSDIRAEMLSVMHDMGLPVATHHHEAAPAQARLGLSFSTLVRAADNIQICKYVAQNVANQYGKTVTFMPKPMNGDNGSAMPTHQSLWQAERPIFAGNLYADLSEAGLHYIGGIIRHAKAINAFTNPTTNSYKRLVPGFAAPVLLAYAARNRSAACRVPYSTAADGRRVEVRYPDPAANPYLAFAAMLMAGLDGIENKIHPGDPIDGNQFDLPPKETKDVPTLCGSLREALGELRADHAFLLKGDVFTRDQIDAYIELKWEEVRKFEHTPHPIEFEMYYSV
jgi:glutamine synthetase